MNQPLKTSLVAGLFVSFAFLSCSKSSNSTSNPASPKNDIRLTTSATFGQVLTDSAGKTLYFFSVDASGNSGCTGGCLAAWPVFYKASPKLDSGLTATDFGVITRTDGSQQTTYKGWPLYYFAQDAVAGDIKGDGVGSVWFVAKPDYTIMLAEGPLKGKDGNFYDSTHTVSPTPVNYVYVTDAYGRTLYSFSADKNGVNNYTTSNATTNAYWPIYQVSAVQRVPSIIDPSSLAIITVFGQTQLTFKGWPLYYFGADNQIRGNTLGVSVPTPGVWPVVNEFSATAPN